MEGEQKIIPKTRVDENQETADIKRLIKAGEQTDDILTTSAGIQRLSRLSKKTGLDMTDPTVVKILGLENLPKK